MSKLKDDARWLVDQITASSNAVKALSKPQLGTSSIEAGAIEEYDAEGTLVSIVGGQFDGTHGAVTVAGPVPPEPVAPSVVVGVDGVEVRWSGKFSEDAVSPMDFSHVSVHVSELEIFEPDNDTQRATITGESGDVATLMLAPGEWHVLLVAVSKAGKWSDPSDTVPVVVEEVLAPDVVLDSLLELDEKYDGVIAEAGNLGTRLDTAEQDLTAAADRLTDAEAELVDAFGQISTVDGKASGAAAAASEAQARADAATAAAVEAYKSVSNMVINGSFEQGWLGWNREGSGGTLDTTVGRTGTTSFQTNNIGGAVQTAFPVATGEVWRLSWWYKTEAGFLSGKPGGLRLRRTDNAGVMADTSGPALVESLEWTQQQMEYTVPSGIRSLGVRFAFAMGAGQKNVWVDDVKFENVTAVKVLESAATAAQSAAAAALAAAGVADGKASAAATAAATAQAKADTAKTAADQAAADALAAAGLAGSKGEIIYQVSAPTGTRANPANLWIRSSDDKPHTYDAATSKWVARTDKAALDAAAAAASAASAAATADALARAAQTAAGTAQSTADSALTMAGTKSKVYYSTEVATGTGSGPGDLWRQRNTTNEVIAEWQWSGTSWIKQTVSGSNVSNMDIGFLTAGAATMSQALINKLVAGTASFQTVDVKNLFVTTGTMAEAVITKLWTDVVMSRKITTQMLAVGSFDNLIAEPDFTNGGASWPPATTRQIITGQARNGGPVFRMTGTGAINSAYNAPSEFPVSGETSWRITAWVRSSQAVAANVYTIFARTRDSSGALTYPAIDPATPALAAGTWTKVTGVITAPESAVTASFALSLRANFPSGATLDFDFVSATRMNGGELTVDGTITARQLEAQMVLVNDIIAGNPLGTHAKMNANGFVSRASTDGQEPVDVVRMGTADSDLISVLDATGNVIAGMDSSGSVSGQSGDFATDISLAGTPLTETLDAMPKGLVAWGGRSTDAKYWAGTTFQPYLHIAFDTPPGRMFRVSTTPIGVNSDVATDAVVNLHVTGNETGDAQATVSSPIVAQGISAQGEFTTRRSPVTINRIVNGGGATSVAMLLSYGVISTGRAKIATSGELRAVYVTIEDIGPSMPQVGELIDGTGDAATSGTGGGSGTPPPPVKNYTKTYLPNGRRSFIGSGATYDYNTGYMYSGLSPSGYGDLSSMAVFPSMTGDLSGATITSIEVYLYYDFWYQGAGGTAYIGLHGQTALTSARPTKTYSHAVSAGWPRAAGRWVKLSSSVYAGFKSGQHRGITLGGSGGGYERYGYAHDPKIKIKYTK